MDPSFPAASARRTRWPRWWRARGKIVARVRPRRVPVALQLGPAECGAACLAMILGYYGYKTHVSDCRAACGLGRDGVDARTLTEAARGYGLRAKAFSLEPAAFAHMPLPAIAHWNFNHFVVVERWSARGATIVDPAVGRCRVTAREFDDAFTGVALALEPGAHVVGRRASGRGQSWIGYLCVAVRRTPGLLVQTLAASLLLQLIGLALPILTGMLVDDVLPLRIADALPTLGMGLLILLAAQAVVAYLRAALLTLVQGRLDAQLMLGFVEHLLALPLDYFRQRATGDLLSRLGSNAAIRDAVTGQTISLILDSLFVLGYLAVLLARDAIFGAVVLGIVALHLALLLGATPPMRACVQRGLAAQAVAQSLLVEAIKGIATLKAAAAEERAFDQWSTLFYKELGARLQRNRLVAIVDTLSLSLRTVAPLALLWVGAVRVLDGAMSVGTMLGLNALATLVLVPLASLAAGAQQLQAIGAHIERIADVMEAEPERAASTTRGAPELRGRVELRNVSFSYTRGAPPTLRDVSIAIQPGQKVALVGRTGSGKSTLAMLLLGLYTPTSGDILYDGVPLQTLDPRAVRRCYGVVLQEPFLFAGSIRQNIAFNIPELPLDGVVTAARRAAIHDEIARMPMGYETLLSEGGGGLSGGQRQRLALARALAHEPAVLLLDEATSALDVATERQIERNLRDLACTRIVIAHRLSTVRDADMIVVLDDGMIIERGTHDVLLTASGHYAALTRYQSTGEADQAQPVA